MARPNEAARRKFAQYVLDRAVDVGLRDWLIEVEFRDELDEGGALAMVTRTFGRKCAQITFADAYWGKDADEKRHVVAHELVHLHLDGMRQAVKDCYTQLGSTAHSYLDDRFNWEHELAADALAYALDEHFPPVPV